MERRTAISAAIFLLMSCVWTGQPGALMGSFQKEETPQPKPVTVKEVARNPEAYLKQFLRVAGKLENKGENLFTDLKVVLRDAEDNEIYVRPWLPISLPPRPPGSSGAKPPVLSDYLGRRVEVDAVLERGTLKKLGEVYILNVKSAKIVRE